MKNQKNDLGKWYLSYQCFNFIEDEYETMEINLEVGNQEEAIIKANIKWNEIIEKSRKINKDENIKKKSIYSILLQMKKYVHFLKKFYEVEPRNPFVVYKISMSVIDKLESRLQKSNQLEVWKYIYKKYFNIDIDISNIEDREEMWPIYVAKGLTMEKVYKVLSGLFPTWKYISGSLDDSIIKNDRIANRDFLIWVNQNIEADEKFKNKSAKYLVKINHSGITLLEGLLLPLFVWIKDKKHLNINNTTLCSGSRDIDGDVPRILICDFEFKVRYCSTLKSNFDIRSREVVFHEIVHS